MLKIRKNENTYSAKDNRLANSHGIVDKFHRCQLFFPISNLHPKMPNIVQRQLFISDPDDHRRFHESPCLFDNVIVEGGGEENALCCRKQTIFYIFDSSVKIVRLPFQHFIGLKRLENSLSERVTHRKCSEIQ